MIFFTFSLATFGSWAKEYDALEIKEKTTMEVRRIMAYSF
jgi:hypothetical protein